MHGEAISPMMSDALVILGAAGIVIPVFARFRITPIIGFILIGLLVGPFGLGRMVLSYPELPADVVAGRKLQRKKVCRTFSDCTTAPRNGLVSGCYPLDPYYKGLPERDRLIEIKQRWQQ